MSDSSTYQRRRDVAARIAAETGIHVEAIHPAGPCAYVVGADRRGCYSAAEARQMARSEQAEQSAE